MFTKTAHRVVGAFIVGCTMTSIVAADMGTTPGGPGSIYMTVDAAYVNPDGPKSFRTGGNQVETSHGIRLGTGLGIILSDELLGLANPRVEGHGSITSYIDDRFGSTTSGLTSQDGAAAVVVLGAVEVIQETKQADFELSFKGDMVINDSMTLTFGLTPFLRHVTTRSALGVNVFNVSTGSTTYGAMLSVQPEFKLGSGFALVGDVSIGGYGYDANGTFTGVVGAPVSSALSGGGFRAKGLAGLKIGITEGVTGTLFGGVDYWSDVASAQQSQGLGDPANLNSDSVLEFTGGIAISADLGNY